MDMEEFVEKSKSELTTGHEFSQLMLSTVVGFVAAKLTEKLYVVVLDSIRKKRTPHA